MAKFRILKSHKLTYRIASQNLLRYGEKLGEAMVEYSVDYFWVVICKNRHKGNTSYEHRIALVETDPFSPQPMLSEDLNVRCDSCGEQYSYKPKDVLRAEIQVPEHFLPHPLFRVGAA